MGEPTHVLEIEHGQGDPAIMPFEEGTELAPFTVGRKGTWRLVAPGVRDVHAFVYFDGSALFVQSADERDPATVGGIAVGKAWTELAPPCVILMGQAQLRFRALYEEHDEVAEAPPPPARRAYEEPAWRPPPRSTPPPPAHRERPFASGAFSSSPDDEATRVGDLVQPRRGLPALDDDSTRVGPVDAAVARVIRPAAGISATGGFQVPGAGGYPGAGSPFAAAPHAGFPQPGAAPEAPPPEAPPPEGLAAQWQAMPTMRKALLVLAPFCLMSAGYMLFAGDDPRARDAAGARTGTVTATVTATPATTLASPAAPPATPAVVVVPSMVPPQVAAPPATAPSSAAGSPAPVASAPEPMAAGQKTLERQALDYVAAGDRVRAVRAYEQLAAMSPQNRVWAEALRILRARGDAGAP